VTDVLVVGGGSTGVGVLRDLAMRGLDARLVERGTLGAETTGHTHGVLHSGARYATGDPDGARECISENRTLREIAGSCIDDTGGFFVRCAGDDADYFERKVEACEACGVPVERLAPDRAREIEPSLPADVEGALSVPDGVVSPSRLVAATARSAIDHGARVDDRTPVEDVLVEDGSVVGVVAGGERIDADHVVNATGAWAGRLAALADCDVEMRPNKGAMVVVNRSVSPVLNRCRPTSDGDIVVPVGDRAILGTTSADVDDPDDLSEEREREVVERLVEECRAMIPSLSLDDVERTYWGVRPIHADAGTGRGASRGFQVIDHARRDDRDGFTSIVGGKLTTHRLMAEAVADRVCDRLGVDAACRTAEERLPGAGDPERLDELVRSFEIDVPADADVVAH
jgi:glycerol-3-phosphate dehydrogenase